MFQGLSDKVLTKIGAHVSELQVPAGSVLTAQGQASREAFIVEDGVAEVRKDDDVVGETTPGELIGEIGVLQNALRSATVVAKTPMQLLVLSVPDLRWFWDDKDLVGLVQANLDRHLGGSKSD